MAEPPLGPFDVAVVGAGPGGYVAAIRAAQYGLRAAVIDRDRVGGICLNHGCIPSKTLIHAAGLFERVRGAAEWGIRTGEVSMDLATLQRRKAEVVKRLGQGIELLLRQNGVAQVAGEARFLTPTRLALDGPEGERTLEARHVILATGGRPVELRALPFDGARVISSKEALDLTETPARLVVVGGGVIGLELGVFYARLGSRVTVVEATDALLPGTDPELVKVVARRLRRLEVEVHLRAMARGLDVKGRLEVGLAQGEGIALEADRVLVAVGVRPNTEALGLAEAGVRTDARGFITVDDQMRTSAPGVFAIGDVAGPPLLAHKASREGLVAAAVAAGRPERYDVRAMPWAVFTDPEIAGVGLTEAEARARGPEPRVGRFPFAASGRALSTGESEGLVKVVAEAASGTVLGVHVVGPEASNLVAEGALAIEMGATLEDLALTVHAHPTLPESMMEAAEQALGLA
ncbi:MAG: dihydrolipoyl dehydrogenase, partial [Planctomycetes bacterium]|nr:dihydrolipoyl dehydrogenase [Planctomycetota bacterium]